MSKGVGDVKGPSKEQVKEAMCRPKPDPDLDDKFGPKETMKNMISRISMIIVLILICYGSGALIQFNIDSNKLKPQIVEVKGDEIVKYVERSKTPTKDFLTHLNPDVDPELAEVIAKAIDKSSEKYNLPRKLVCAIIKNESNINPFAKSNVDAIGLMQVLPKYHKERIGNRNLWHISVNVDVGCNILADYLKMEKGSLSKTFHRYLSKNATQVQLEKYTSGIYKYWSKLEMYDYLSTQERYENEDGKGDFESTKHSSQTESQPDEPDLQKK